LIKVFRSQEEYVSFLTSLKINRGEMFCTTFLPVFLFPKDSIDFYYSRISIPAKPKKVTKELWAYVQSQKRAAKEQKAIFCVDVDAISSLCNQGIVHAANPTFTVTYPVRAAVLDNMLEFVANGSLIFVKGPIPYVFRLHAPKGVLIDVNYNISTQRVQGIWINQRDAQEAFTEEFNRLRLTMDSVSKERLINSILKACNDLAEGASHKWSI
jgi:hypothetical protein